MSSEVHSIMAEEQAQQGLRWWRLGIHDRAAECLAAAAHLMPGNVQYRVRLGELVRWRQVCRRQIGGDVVAGPAPPRKDAYLSMLGLQHAAWLYEAQRQAELATWANVPRLRSLADEVIDAHGD